MTNIAAPSMGLFTCQKDQKTYVHELAKASHWRVIETPKVIADWVVQIADWVGQSGVFTEASKAVSTGFNKIMSAESLVYLAGDICELPGAVIALKNRVIDLEGAQEWASEKLVAVAHEVRRLVCLIGGTVADWGEVCDFLKNVKVLGQNAKEWFIPAEVVTKVGGAMIGASKVFDISAGYEKTSIEETEDKELNEVKSKVAIEKDNANLVQWSSIFAINAVGLGALAMGVALAPVVTLALSTTIFASRIVMHYKQFELESLNAMDSQTKAAVADLKR